MKFRQWLMKTLGSATSGNFGHAGRPGQRGGSSSDDAAIMPEGSFITDSDGREHNVSGLSKKSAAFVEKHPYLYHITGRDTKTLSGIAKKGLLPSKAEDVITGQNQLFLAVTPKQTEYYHQVGDVGSTLFRARTENVLKKVGGLYSENQKGMEYDESTGEALSPVGIDVKELQQAMTIGREIVGWKNLTSRTDFYKLKRNAFFINPFKSEAQRRWMWENDPDMAKEWEKHTKEKKLSKKVKVNEVLDVDVPMASVVLSVVRANGGEGSGNFGHAGRPGERGGSAGSWTSGSVWHGTRGEFTEFSTTAPATHRTGTAASQPAFIYFSKDKDAAARYANKGTGPRRLIEAKLTHKNLLNITDDINNRGKDVSFGEAKRRALAKLTDEHDGFVFDGDEMNPPEVAVRSASQVSIVEKENGNKHNGSATSGNFGHAGRPGQRGGSSKEGGVQEQSKTQPSSVFRTAVEKVLAAYTDPHDASFNTPARRWPQSIKNVGGSTMDYRVAWVKMSDITPSQEGEDRWNDSSKQELEDYKEVARGSVSLDDLRLKDYDPIILDSKGVILDGNHRYAVGEHSGATEILALVPVKKGTGRIINMESFFTSIKANGSATSGNFGHAGRPGQRGGSSKRGGTSEPAPAPTPAPKEEPMTVASVRQAAMNGDVAPLKQFAASKAAEFKEKTQTLTDKIADTRVQHTALYESVSRKNVDVILAENAVMHYEAGNTYDWTQDLPENAIADLTPALRKIQSLDEARVFYRNVLVEKDREEKSLGVIEERLTSMLRERRALKDAANAEIRQALAVDTTEEEASPHLVNERRQVRLGKEHEDAMTWVSQVVNPKALWAPCSVNRTDRSNSGYSSNSRRILLKYGADAGTLVHELGHHIHDSLPLEMTAPIAEFFNRRTADEPLVEYPNNPGVMVKADHFHTPYAGRVYVGSNFSAGQEIFSTGLEAMYRDPVSFREADKEHFDMIVDILAASRKLN